MGERPLCGLFPHLYHLMSLKNNFVFDFLVWSGCSCSFFFGFRRPLFDREATDVAAFLSILDHHSFSRGRSDGKFWSPNPLEEFLCKFFFIIWLILL